MSDVELEVSRGMLRFRGRGPREWVEEQFAIVFNAGGQGGNDIDERDPPVDEKRNLGGSSNAADRAKRWMTQQQVSQEQLDRAFHGSGEEIHLIMQELPGGSNKDKCVNAYILAGLQSVLAGRDGQFADDQAREICTHYGAYDRNNHSKVLNGLRPSVTGSKSAGWQITAPGLAAAAALIKQLK